MNFANLLEASMLICFGFSWPLNVIKAYKARTAKGTSLAFIILIITGYVAGISAKILNHQFNYVLAVYFLNLAIVSANVFVYIRNKALDKKAAKPELKINPQDIKTAAAKEEEDMLNYSNSLDEVIDRKDPAAEHTGSVILLGGTTDRQIPVAQLAEEFSFNFDIYNKSSNKLSIKDAEVYFKANVAQLLPEGMIIHLGEEDVTLFKNDSETFDRCYLNFISCIRSVNSKCRLALVSVSNPDNDKTLVQLNSHIKAIAQADEAVFVNLDNAKLWNPEASKEAAEFAYSMGLRVKKPLRDVAGIFYSWAFNNIVAKPQETMAV